METQCQGLALLPLHWNAVLTSGWFWFEAHTTC
jgi:hypothetical protein